MSEDYNFIGYKGDNEPYTPVLVTLPDGSGYYWTGAYIYYFPDVSNLDVPTYGYQVEANEAWSFTSRDNWLNGSQATLQAAFISAVNAGQTWEPLTDTNKFCIPVIQHGKKNSWVEKIPVPDYNKLSSVVISPATSSATVGTAYSQLFTTTCQEGDDGSYSYSWSASGSTSGMSLDNATIANPTLSGTPTTSGSITLTVLVTDSYGNKATSSSTVSIATGAAHATSGTVSLSNSSATVGSAFSCTASLIDLVEPDDGTYTYAWSFNGDSNGLTFDNIKSKTPTISGTPTTATSLPVRCSVKDSYGNYATITPESIVISAATPTGINITGDSAVIHAGNQSTYSTHGKPYSRNWWVTIADSSGGSVTDDGTLTYLWYWIDNTTGTGLVFDPDNAANIMIDGTPTKAGQAHMQCDITDVYGNKVTAPSQGISIS